MPLGNARGRCPHTTILTLNQILQKSATTVLSPLDLREEVKAVPVGISRTTPTVPEQPYTTPLLSHPPAARAPPPTPFIFKVSASCFVPYIVLFCAAKALPLKSGTSQKQPSPSALLKRCYPLPEQ